jgi:hypothetical protein
MRKELRRLKVEIDSEIEELERRLEKENKLTEELKKSNKLKCIHCNLIFEGIYYKCALHSNIFCPKCATTIVKRKNGTIYEGDQAHCPEQAKGKDHRECVWEKKERSNAK